MERFESCLVEKEKEVSRLNLVLEQSSAAAHLSSLQDQLAAAQVNQADPPATTHPLKINYIS